MKEKTLYSFDSALKSFWQISKTGKKLINYNKEHS